MYEAIAKVMREEFTGVDVIDYERAGKRVLNIMAPSGDRVYSIRNIEKFLEMKSLKNLKISKR